MAHLHQETKVNLGLKNPKLLFMNFNFLNQINTIIKLYEKHAELSGENFNIFSIMNMESDEVRTHSAIIGELLNPKGSHGLGTEPLNLFIEQISEKVKSESLDINSVQCFKEFYVGKINENYDEGGRIDLIVVDNNKNGFVIENKVYAGEQEKQLQRYKYAYPEAEIIFLTLFGDESKDENSTPYTSISYENEILRWIESCAKIAYDKPMVREVLNQYAFLIKKLTNQTTNKEMSDEIIKIIKDNFEASEEIFKNFQKVLEIKQNDFLDSVLDKLKTEFVGWEIERTIHKGNECITLTRNGILIRFRIKTFKHSAFGIEGIKELNKELKTEGFSENKKDIIGNQPYYWLVKDNDITSWDLVNSDAKINEIVKKLKNIAFNSNQISQ